MLWQQIIIQLNDDIQMQCLLIPTWQLFIYRTGTAMSNVHNHNECLYTHAYQHVKHVYKYDVYRQRATRVVQ